MVLIHQCYRRTDRRTDDKQSLCTKVNRAVKNSYAKYDEVVHCSLKILERAESNYIYPISSVICVFR